MRESASPGDRISAITVPTATSSPGLAVTAASVPSCRRLELDGDLVRLDLDQRLVLCHGVALSVEPAHHPAGVLGDAQGRHDHIGCHLSPA